MEVQIKMPIRKKKAKEKCKTVKRDGKRSLLCKRNGEGPVVAIPKDNGEGHEFINEGEINPEEEAKLIDNMKKRINNGNRQNDSEGLDGEF